MLKTELELCKFLGGARTQDGVFLRFNEFFCHVFEEFVGFWATHPENSSFMNFNRVLVSASNPSTSTSTSSSIWPGTWATSVTRPT